MQDDDSLNPRRHHPPPLRTVSSQRPRSSDYAQHEGEFNLSPRLAPVSLRAPLPPPTPLPFHSSHVPRKHENANGSKSRSRLEKLAMVVDVVLTLGMLLLVAYLMMHA